MHQSYGQTSEKGHAQRKTKQEAIFNTRNQSNRIQNSSFENFKHTRIQKNPNADTDTKQHEVRMNVGMNLFENCTAMGNQCKTWKKNHLTKIADSTNEFEEIDFEENKFTKLKFIIQITDD